MIKVAMETLQYNEDEKWAITELGLYINNDEQLYSSRVIPMIKNMQYKIRKGTFDLSRCPKMWRRLVDEAKLKYANDIAVDDSRLFTVKVRARVSEILAKDYYNEIVCQGGEMIPDGRKKN